MEGRLNLGQESNVCRRVSGASQESGGNLFRREKVGSSTSSSGGGEGGFQLAPGIFPEDQQVDNGVEVVT